MESTSEGARKPVKSLPEPSPRGEVSEKQKKAQQLHELKASWMGWKKAKVKESEDGGGGEHKKLEEKRERRFSIGAGSRVPTLSKGGLSQTQKIASELRKAVIGPGLVRSSTLNKISTSSQSSVGATATKTLPSSSSLDTSSLQLKANASSSADGVDVNWGEFNEAPETLQKAESSSSDCDDAWRRNTVRMNREASPSSATSETECSLLEADGSESVAVLTLSDDGDGDDVDNGNPPDLASPSLEKSLAVGVDYDVLGGGQSQTVANDKASEKAELELRGAVENSRQMEDGLVGLSSDEACAKLVNAKGEESEETEDGRSFLTTSDDSSARSDDLSGRRDDTMVEKQEAKPENDDAEQESDVKDAEVVEEVEKETERKTPREQRTENDDANEEDEESDLEDEFEEVREQLQRLEKDLRRDESEIETAETTPTHDKTGEKLETSEVVGQEQAQERGQEGQKEEERETDKDESEHESSEQALSERDVRESTQGEATVGHDGEAMLDEKGAAAELEGDLSSERMLDQLRELTNAALEMETEMEHTREENMSVHIQFRRTLIKIDEVERANRSLLKDLKDVNDAKFQSDLKEITTKMDDTAIFTRRVLRFSPVEEDDSIPVKAGWMHVRYGNYSWAQKFVTLHEHTSTLRILSASSSSSPEKNICLRTVSQMRQLDSSPTGFAVELLTSSVDSVVSIACEASEYSSWCSALGKIIFADHPEIVSPRSREDSTGSTPVRAMFSSPNFAKMDEQILKKSQDTGEHMERVDSLKMSDLEAMRQTIMDEKGAFSRRKSQTAATMDSAKSAEKSSKKTPMLKRKSTIKGTLLRGFGKKQDKSRAYVEFD